MACRNCVDTCNCAIVSTNGSLTVTGSGTALAPYDLKVGVTQSTTYTALGNLSAAAGTARLYFSNAVTITNVIAGVGTAPTGAPILIDVNRNGTTIFTTQANRPTIAVSTNSDTASVPDVTAVAAGQYLTIDIDQVGSGVTGADLVVTVEYVRA